MKIFRTLAVSFMLLVYINNGMAEDVDTTSQKFFSGEAYTEVNYGHKSYDDNRTKWDFPHIVLDGNLNLGKGWTISAEFEYERFYEDGEWGNNFRDNFTTNKFYVNKSWGDAVNVKAGIIEVPVGITNSGGPALTIYDPESEAALIPMTWHDGGAAFWGRYKNIDYTIGALTYIDFPLKKSRMLGGTARLDYHIIEGLRAGISGYWGQSHQGQVLYAGPGFLGIDKHVFTGAIDADYQASNWIVSASYIYTDADDAQSFGAEAGYDILHATLGENSQFALIPFIRYDGIFHTDTPACNKYTAGLNFTPWSTLTLKAEYGWRHYAGENTQRTFDLGIGYTLDF